MTEKSGVIRVANGPDSSYRRKLGLNSPQISENPPDRIEVENKLHELMKAVKLMAFIGKINSIIPRPPDKPNIDYRDYFYAKAAGEEDFQFDLQEKLGALSNTVTNVVYNTPDHIQYEHHDKIGDPVHIEHGLYTMRHATLKDGDQLIVLSCAWPVHPRSKEERANNAPQYIAFSLKKERAIDLLKTIIDDPQSLRKFILELMHQNPSFAEKLPKVQTLLIAKRDGLNSIALNHRSPQLIEVKSGHRPANAKDYLGELIGWQQKFGWLNSTNNNMQKGYEPFSQTPVSSDLSSFGIILR